MKILVTGAAGFMGSHLVDHLVKKKERVFAIDDLSGGFKRNLNPNAEFFKLDLRKKNETASIIGKIKPEIIYHLAADATEGRSQFTPMSAIERNMVAYTNTLVSAIKNGVKKVVLTSSMSVYGSQKPPFNELQPRKPDDVYGIAKAAMEQLTEVLAHVHNFKYTIIRPHNVYGPKQNLSDPYRNVIGIFINCLLQNKHYYIYGKGNQKRAFTYIDDFTPYIAKCGTLNKYNKEIFNIGPSKGYTINELSHLVLSIFYGKKHVPKSLIPKNLPMRPQEVVDAYCTSNKAKSMLGYVTSVTLDEGVRRMIEWARKVGPQEFVYLDNLELENRNVPPAWKKKLI